MPLGKAWNWRCVSSTVSMWKIGSGDVCGSMLAEKFFSSLLFVRYLDGWDFLHGESAWRLCRDTRIIAHVHGMGVQWGFCVMSCMGGTG